MVGEEFTALIQSMHAVATHVGDEKLETWLKDFFNCEHSRACDDISVNVSSDIAEFVPCYHKACNTITFLDLNSLLLAKEIVVRLIQKIEAYNVTSRIDLRYSFDISYKS